eukprot:5220242-Prymnesium_polylepis.1
MVGWHAVNSLSRLCVCGRRVCTRSYGSAMIFFSFVIGLTAVLTALETPVLEARARARTNPPRAALLALVDRDVCRGPSADAAPSPCAQQVAVEGLRDEVCLEMASNMMFGARDHAALASLGCLVDTLGAVLAIRSKELFTYEEISAQHAAVASAQTL